MIAARGYAATSIREIAAKAGISIGTLLHHFETKAEILSACMDVIVDTWDRGAEAILRAPGTPLERLEGLVRWVLGDPEYDYLWRVYMAFWHEAVFDPRTKASILEGNASWDASVAACVREAIAAGELEGDDPDRIGKSLTTMIDGVAIHIHGRLGRWDRETGIQLCLDLLHSYRPAGQSVTGRSREIVRVVVDAWNSHDVDRICSYFHDDFENWQAPLPPARGLANYRKHLEQWFSAYPDLHLEIVTLFAEGELVCLETQASGSAVASFFDVVPRAVASVNRALDILVLLDGKVWRERGYWDFSLWAGEASPLARSLGP